MEVIWPPSIHVQCTPGQRASCSSTASGAALIVAACDEEQTLRLQRREPFAQEHVSKSKSA